MAGFAAGIGGFGKSALEYGEGIRNRNLQQWGVIQSHLAQLLEQAAKTATTPERQTTLYGLRAKALNAVPGQDNSKLIQDIQEHLDVHPQVAQHFEPQQPPPPKPGPAGLGEVPGQGTLINPVAAQPQSLAQPSSNPIAGGGQSSAPEAPAAAPTIPMLTGGESPIAPPQAALAPSGAAPISPVGAASIPPPMASPQAFGGGNVEKLLDSYFAAIQSGSMPEGLKVAAEPFLTNLATKHGQVLMDEYLLQKLGPERIAFLKAQPGFDQAPPQYKLAVAANAIGMTAPSMAGIGSLMTPTSLQIDAGAMTAEEKAKYGLAPDSVGKFTVLRDKVTGQNISVTPGWAGTVTETDSQGDKHVRTTADALKMPGENVAPGLLNFHYSPNAGGGVQATRGIDLLRGNAPTPVPGAVTPSMASTQRTNSTTQTEGGSTSTSTVRKVFGPAASQPIGTNIPKPGEPSSPPTHGPSGQVLGTTKFQDDVKATVDAMLQPNLSEAQQNTIFKRMVGPEKSPMASAVRAEIRRRVADDSRPFVWDAPVAQMAQRSKQVLTHINNIESTIDRLDKSGQLGPVMSRWNEFWANKVGSDLTQNQDYIALANNLDLLTKAMGYVHGGARGGGSIQMIESFKKKLDVGHMDAATLKGAIGAEKDWLNTYAHPNEAYENKGKSGSIPPPTSSVDELVKKYGGR